MVSVSCYQKGVATTLTPLLSKLSAGTEMASYGPPQWRFLLGGGDIDAYVAPSDDDDDGDKLLGSLLRVELNPVTITATVVDEDNDSSLPPPAAAGFGMMLVSPAARGKGVAKLLLNEAINADGTSSPEISIRKLLPVCTAAGQPVYRKLGFSDVGVVTSLSTTIQNARDIPLLNDDNKNNNKCNINVKTYGSMDKNIDECDAKIDSKIRDLVIGMDSKATGYDRTNRLSFMLKNDDEEDDDNDNVKTIVATAVIAENGKKETVDGVAVIRREMLGGPYVVGPLIGSPETALPLVKALAKAVPDDSRDSKIAVLISDHPELVEEFKSYANFEQGFDFPAMSLDGKPIYENGDGSYLGIIHPTLG